MKETSFAAGSLHCDGPAEGSVTTVEGSNVCVGDTAAGSSGSIKDSKITLGPNLGVVISSY